jgi:Domain of unknown function (DUF6362)
MPGNRRSGPLGPAHRPRLAGGAPFWTAALVQQNLRKAVVVREELSAQMPVIGRRSAARGIGTRGGSGSNIDSGSDNADFAVDAAETLSWLAWLEPDEATLVEARIEGASWKAICFRFGISRPTADRRWRCALRLIAWRLNGYPSTPRPSLRALLRQPWPESGCETSPGGTRTVLSG